MTRTDRRRFPAIAALALVGAVLGLLFSPLQAQADSAPAKPTGLSATASHNQVVLTWDDPDDDTITGYVILRRVRENDVGGEFSELVPDTGTAATTYTDDTVQAGTTYTYRIKAINEHGVSERSLWFHIDTPSAPVPAKPTGLSATATHDQVVLTWDDPNDDSITGYVILRRVRENDVGGEFSELVPDTGTAATTYTDDTVQAGITYTYRIKAINEHGVSERSLWFHIDTPAAPERPAKPTGLSATATHDRVVLTWDDPGDDSITGYVILRRVRENDVGGEFSVLVADTGTAATTYTDDTVAAGITYTYRIKAINEHGVSERSLWFHIDTPAAPQATFVEGDDPDEQAGEDGGGGAPGHATPPGPGARANVSEPDGEDLPADNTTTGHVDVGGSVTGNIDADGDYDWFRVDLEAGKIYQFDLEGAASGSGTLPDPFLWLYDTTESHIVSNDDGPLGLDSQIIHEATATGAYYLRAATLPTATTKIGTYRLSVTEVERRTAEGDMDFSGTTNTLGRVDVGGSATGNIESATDLDGFHVDLETGKVYQFHMEGAPTSRGTLLNPSLFLESSAGEPLAGYDDIDPVNNLNSRFEYRATATDTYLLLAHASDRATGTYTLSVRDITSDRVPDDSGNVSEGDLDLPHHGNSLGQVTVGGTVTGAHTDGDKDWFALFDVQAGKRYQIDVEGADTGRGTHPDPAVSLYSISEVFIVSDNDSGMGTNARIIFTPLPEIHGRLFFVEAADDSKGGGTYTLSVILLGATGASEADLDFPVTTATTGRVEVGASATGNIDPGDDLDGFRVNLEAGKRYRFDLEGADTGRGSQADPILALYGDSFNVSHYIDEDDDGGEGLNSRLTYTATATGTYHLEVAGLDPGTYTLSVRRILVPVAVPPGGLGPSEVPGAVRNVVVPGTGRSRVVYWDAPDETQTGAQWITEFRIYASTGAGCDGWKAAEYEVEHPGFTTPPEHPDGTPTGFRYFKIVEVASDTDEVTIQFGVSAVNELGEGPCVGEPAPSSKLVVADGPPGLVPNAPNPFNANTLIPYRLDADGPVRLEIYNLLGQSMRTLVDEVQAAGTYWVRWDARDGRGAAVAAGVYLVRLHYPGGVQTQRMLYLK